MRKEKIKKLEQFSTLTDYEIDESWKRKYRGCWRWRLSSDFLDLREFKIRMMGWHPDLLDFKFTQNFVFFKTLIYSLNFSIIKCKFCSLIKYVTLSYTIKTVEKYNKIINKINKYFLVLDKFIIKIYKLKNTTM